MGPAPTAGEVGSSHSARTHALTVSRSLRSARMCIQAHPFVTFVFFVVEKTGLIFIALSQNNQTKIQLPDFYQSDQTDVN